MAVWRVGLGRQLSQLTSRNKPLANNEAAKCSILAREPARAAGCLAAVGRSSNQQLLSEHSPLVQDDRHHEESCIWPDSHCRGSQQVSAGSDSKLADGARSLAFSWSVPDDDVPGKPGMTPETVRELCHQGQLSEAVEALGVLVHIDAHVSKALFYTVLKQCNARKDLPLSRRVHALSLKKGYESDTFLCNHILRMYASHARLQEGMDVFSSVDKPDAFMWSSIISAHVKQGQHNQALQLYDRMRRSDVKPDSHVFVAALQACAKGGDLKSGQRVHGDLLASDVELNLFVCSCLVDMYAKCGSLQDARRVFDILPNKDVVTWSAMIAGYSQKGMGQEALHLYRAMQEQGIVAPDSVTFVSVLQACANVGNSALEQGRQFHAQIRKRGLQSDVFIANSLVNMYAKCGSLEDAQGVFDTLQQKTVVTWSAMIAGYCQHSMVQEALRLHNAMQEEGVVAPDSVTFVGLLQACARLGSLGLEKGKQLHAQIREQGLHVDAFLASSLVNMYAKCGSIGDARGVFDRLPQKNVVTWNAMISGYSQQGMGQESLFLYRDMQEEGIAAPNSGTFVPLLQACASVGTQALEKGRMLHAHIGERGLQADVFVGNSLVTMYAKCGSLKDAQAVFDGLPQKDVVTWNAMIAGYSQRGMGQEALHLLSAMQEEGMDAPNSVTFVSLLQACASVGAPALDKGKQLHAELREQGFQDDVFVGNSLVNMYAKCSSLEDAQSMFEGLSLKNVVTWNAMIAGYSQQGMGQEALHLYNAMKEEGKVAPDSVTFVCLLQACAYLGTPALEMGKQLHAQIRDQGLQADVVVGGSLVNMYAKCGSLEDAQNLFDGLGEKSVVTWSAMIAAYSQQGRGQEALSLYRAMQREGTVPLDCVTSVCLLQACASVAALHVGRELHSQIQDQGLHTDTTVGNSLINMYAKLGSMVDAQQVFDALPERDVVTWSALIAGYTRQGSGEEVFDLFVRMREDGIHPDGITFLSILTVCSHTGLVNKGREYFEAMSRDHGITPTADHYTCMVDLLGRGGQLDEALALIRRMPVAPDAAVWHTLLSACRKWSNVEVGCQAFEEAVKLDKKDAAAYVLMSNIYTGAGMWEQAKEMQARRRRDGAWKQPGQSWWTDMDGLVHSFLVGDENQGSRAETGSEAGFTKMEVATTGHQSCFRGDSFATPV